VSLHNLPRANGSAKQPIKEALLENDLRQVRRLVNGGTTGVTRFSDAFTIGQRLLA
jgi:putative chitinase